MRRRLQAGAPSRAPHLQAPAHGRGAQQRCAKAREQRARRRGRRELQLQQRARELRARERERAARGREARGQGGIELAHDARAGKRVGRGLPRCCQRRRRRAGLGRCGRARRGRGRRAALRQLLLPPPVPRAGRGPARRRRAVARRRRRHCGRCRGGRARPQRRPLLRHWARPLPAWRLLLHGAALPGVRVASRPAPTAVR
jgi:hypothetical protein